MRWQLSAGLPAVLLVVLLATAASAQVPDGGTIGVYVDEPATGCLIQDTPGIVTAYIVHTDVTEANTSQFAFEIDPSVQMNFLSGTVSPGMISLGNLFEGITITYVGCKTTFPLTLMTLTFWGDASTTICGALRIVPDPSLSSGQVEVVDCSLNVRYARTSNAWVNDGGDCECVYSAYVAIETSPPGLDVSVDGHAYTSPRYFNWDSGTSHLLSATSPQGPPDLTYYLAGWSDGGADTHSIVIGDRDTTVTALFELGPRTRIDTAPAGLNVYVDGVFHTAPYDAHWRPGSLHWLRTTTPQGPPESPIHFLGWSDGGEIIHSVVAGDFDTTFTAIFGEPAEVVIDTEPTGLDIFVDGVPRVAPFVTSWLWGTTHSIEAVSPQGDDTVYLFSAWSDSGDVAHDVVMGLDDTTLVATFSVAYEAAFATTPPGLDVVVDGMTHTTPYAEYWIPGTNHEIGTFATQGADTVYVFSGWSDGGTMSHGVVAGANDTTFVAMFELPPRVEITTTPPGLDIVVDTTPHVAPYMTFWLPGSTHAIEAVSPQGTDRVYIFTAWSDSGAEAHDVTIGASDTTFVADFERVTPVTLNTVPAGHDLTADSVTYTTPKVLYWLPGTSHTVSAPDSIHDGWQTHEFLGWSDGGEQQHTVVTPDTATALLAYYVAVVGIDGQSVPLGIVLRQNTPNPFNPTTRIEFSVPQRQFAELFIFDVSGSLIRRLHSGDVPEGLTVLKWNGRNDGGEPVGSGVYFYQLRTREERVTRKMVLLK